MFCQMTQSAADHLPAVLVSSDASSRKNFAQAEQATHQVLNFCCCCCLSSCCCCCCCCCRGFPVHHFASNRAGLVVAFWGWALLLGRVQISQTDWNSKGEVFGSIFNHVTVGRFADGECWFELLGEAYAVAKLA
jgi:hypothetical protein